MIVVAVACLAVAIGLGVVLVRTRTRLSDLEIALHGVTNQRDAAQAQAAEAVERAAVALQERDDAFERVQRARRDAAEVAARLSDETAARAEALAAADAATSRCEIVERELAEARDLVDEMMVEIQDLRRQREAHVQVPSASGAWEADLLWDLALARAEQRWRMSISLSIDDESPLAGSDDQLRAAIEIEIDAAREESGADIDLHWSGETPAPPAAGVVAYSLVESVVAALATTAARTVVHVEVGEDDIRLRFDVTDDTGRPMEPELPSAIRDAPGAVRIPLASP